MDDIKNKFSQYIFPGLLTLVGLLILITGTQQNWMFKIGGAAIALVGVIAILQIAGILKKSTAIVVTIVTVAASAGVAYLDYHSIDSRLDYLKRKEMIESHVVQRLKDIRTAQVAFHDANQRYTSNWDTLENFILTGQIPQIQAYGEKPDTLTEAEALELGLIVRDTIYQSVLQHEFLSEEALNKRKYPFHIDSLRYVPFGNGTEFYLNASTILDASGRRSAVVLVEDPQPFGDKAYKFGDMEKVTVSGNWTE